MSIQNDADRQGLEAAGAVVHLTLEALAAAVRPGVSTGDLDAVAFVRFASVYREFNDVYDFFEELRPMLDQNRKPPK